MGIIGEKLCLVWDIQLLLRLFLGKYEMSVLKNIELNNWHQIRQENHRVGWELNINDRKVHHELEGVDHA